MSDIDPAIIKKMLEVRAKDLLELVEGDSRCCKAVPSNIPKSSDESYVLRMACEHMWFVSEFGLELAKSEKDGKYYSAYSGYFDQWLSLGCLALSSEALTAYLKDNPLS